MLDHIQADRKITLKAFSEGLSARHRRHLQAGFLKGLHEHC